MCVDISDDKAAPPNSILVGEIHPPFVDLRELCSGLLPGVSFALRKPW